MLRRSKIKLDVVSGYGQKCFRVFIYGKGALICKNKELIFLTFSFRAQTNYERTY